MTTLNFTVTENMAAVGRIFKHTGSFRMEKVTFIMTLEDAKLFCSHPHTANDKMMYVFNSLSDYVNEKTNVLPNNKIAARTTKYDGLMADLNITPLSF